MRIGVVIVPTDSWPIAVAQARAVEALGFDHLWTYDHLSWQHYRDEPWFAALPWLTGIATATDRIRIGTLVSSPNFREPLTLAKDAIAIDHISDGRFILGVGAGGVGYDATVYGTDVVDPRSRSTRFGEFVEAIDGLLTHHAFSYHGEYYVIDDARTTPGPKQVPRLPLAVAAAGPKAIALAARFADAWITIGDPWHSDSATGIARAVHDQSHRLTDACIAIGRDPTTIDRIWLTGAGNHRPLAGMAAFDDAVGRADAAGITDVVVHHPRPADPNWDDPPEILDQIAEGLPTRSP